MTQPSIAIIGAGISGLVIAQALKNLAHITIYEKARGVSGRMSTRSATPYQFDHGAQYFTAKTQAFQAFLAPYLAEGSIALWQPQIIVLEKDKPSYNYENSQPKYVATPKMNSLGKILAEGIPICLQTQIATLQRSGEKWQLITTAGVTLPRFDWVISTAPAPQTLNIFPPAFSEYHTLQQVKMLACYCLMVGLPTQPALNWQAAVVLNSPIGWIAYNTHKPGRNQAYHSMVLQSTNNWAEEHLEEDLANIQHLLLEESIKLTGIEPKNLSYITTHRWRYADTAISAQKNYLLDESLQLAACGDWCIKGRVEAAFTSGNSLASRMVQLL
ncbi:MAG: NAD(P)-binding protein [Gomphosphaeria aponina SAG 52.96 = DSM 107014]|uniref:NAD(P)-binding protein n=1 Tax=Gomphosphaeria aponina SAG 52.96 = DSM 107014 TaxID=1521640 RepID=A0A941GTV8_9CHRO|nr:NAD(P)-binding protein [Gomphosphaeria aponina SAG 52.96 = DSM 107014]